MYDLIVPIVAIAILSSACVSSAAFAQSRTPPGPGAPVRAPALGIIPTNASRITARVRAYAVWPPGSLSGRRPAVRPGQALYSFTVEVVTVGPEQADEPSMAQAGATIEAFSTGPLDPQLVGTTIEATLRLTGDTLGSRWIISGVGPSE